MAGSALPIFWCRALAWALLLVGLARGVAGAEAVATATSLEIRLFYGDRPVPEARRVYVEQRTGRGHWYRVAEVPAGKSLTLTGMPPATYEVTLLEREGWERSRTARIPGHGTIVVFERVDVREGNRTQVALQVYGGCQLAGVLTGPPELLRKRAEVALLRREQDAYWWHLPLPPRVSWTEVDPGRLEFACSDVPPGEYLVRCRLAGAHVASQRISIGLGESPRVAFQAEPAQASFALSFPPDAYTALLGERMSVLAVTWRTSSPNRVGRVDCDLDAGGVLAGLTGDSYLVFFEGAGLATLAELRPEGSTELAFRPPHAVLGTGRANVRLRLARGDLWTLRMGVALVPAAQAEGGPRTGAWMRYARPRSRDNEASFPSVPAGDYEVWVFDRTLGAVYDLAESPVRFPLHVGETDLDVVLDVDDAHAR